MNTTADNKRAIRSALSMSGGLFQRHPEDEHWRTTRPGAQTAEIAAFKHDEPWAYISVMYWEEGDVDEDGYEWQNTGYLIEVMEVDLFKKEFVTERDDAVEYIVAAMERINEVNG